MLWDRPQSALVSRWAVGSEASRVAFIKAFAGPLSTRPKRGMVTKATIIT